ncbi:hypothetical protein D3C76_1666850 [compost metagenome]
MPVAIRPAAIVSGLTDQEIILLLSSSPDFDLAAGQIEYRDPFAREVELMEQELAKVLTVEQADMLYREENCAFLCAAGRLIGTFIDRTVLSQSLSDYVAMQKSSLS